MPGIVALVAKISDDVVTRLGATTPPVVLTAGKILLGRQHTVEGAYVAPRIVFVPKSSRFGARDTSNASVIETNPSSEMVAQWAQRSIHTDKVRFEIECWGVSTAGPGGTPDPDADFDATQLLYQTVIASIRTNITGQYTLEDGTWVDQDENAAQLQKIGHRFVFGIEINTPILDVRYPPVTITSVQGPVGFTGNTAAGETVIVTVP